MPRRDGFNEARDTLETESARNRICLGLPHPEREAWVLAGFFDKMMTKKSGFDQLRSDLGFNPVVNAHRLDARCEHDPDGVSNPKSTKNVLAALTEGSAELAEACWQETSLKLLRERGQENGLSDYLRDVEARLVPTVGTPDQ